MKIHVTFDFDEDTRRAIGSLTSSTNKPASWSRCKSWIESTVMADLESVIADYNAAVAGSHIEVRPE